MKKMRSGMFPFKSQPSAQTKVAIFIAILLGVLGPLTLSGCVNEDTLVPPEPIGSSNNIHTFNQNQMANMSEKSVSTDFAPTYNTMAHASSEPIQSKPLGNDQAGPVTIQKNNRAYQRSNNINAGRHPEEKKAAMAQGSIRFLPVIGAPVRIITPLSQSLGRQARANHLVIKSSNDDAADIMLKGYLSAVSQDNNTLVTYVWDILDHSGKRLHRIEGQETVPGTARDPWSIVPNKIMVQIATKTINKYLQWHAQQGRSHE